MAEHELTSRAAPTRRRSGTAPRRRLRTAATVRYRLTPWWMRILVIFVASRIVTTAILLGYAAVQDRNAWTAAHPGYLDFAMIWDSHWYYVISAVGYPSELPVLADGTVGQNAWAFMPVYPMLLRLLGWVTALPYAQLAVAVSVLSALGAALVFYRMLRRRLPEGTAMFSVVLFCVAPCSPILQVGYAESLGLLLLAVGLLLLLDRRYPLLVPVVIVMSLTRPSGLAFALLLLLHLIVRWRRRVDDPFRPGELPGLIVAGSTSAAAGLTWPIAAWLGTGRMSAYTDTELAWRSAYIGHQELVPFTPWVQGFEWWARWNRVVEPYALVAAIVLVLLLVVAFALLLLSPAARRLGTDLRLWLAAYGLYLLAVWFPQSSTFRLLMPMFPALAIAAQPRSALYRIGLVLAGIALQVGWVHIGWWVNGADWSPP